jgi:hypothetical protein
MDKDIIKIAQGTANADLKVRFTISLDDTGMLRVDVVCDESGQTMTITRPSDKDLVSYI